jgi:polyisoprenoid-binding protein YceI
MNRRMVIFGGVVLLVILGGAAAAYAYFFSGLRTTPRPLAVSSPSAQTSAKPSAASALGSLAGSWTVGSGSQAGYRVKEQFAGQTSTHEAVARTSTVAGGFSAVKGTGGYQLSNVKVNVQLSSLQSVDQVAGFNVSQRDRIVQRSLSVTQYPEAVFQASSVTVPANLDSGQTVTVQVPGQLTVHGTTKDVVANVQARATASGVEVVGSIPTNMTDFGVSPPQVPITTVQPATTIEFQLELAKSS